MSPGGLVALFSATWHSACPSPAVHEPNGTRYERDEEMRLSLHARSNAVTRFMFGILILLLTLIVVGPATG